ncbi:hypothetical protein [Burkholderia pseudomallei]|uniref:hypothetical protein n=1 Tax=Burkholderia pseudomallei TaxID=28450 RepID=UPI001AD68F8B|nr:hypothetical protein [Burkholderia pseudomallei]MBO7796506.1 hypothetical protein [Burkholderia pseudomallei]MBO7815279.1 hypothetical protein [Burkholderia pseudomallei]
MQQSAHQWIQAGAVVATVLWRSKQRESAWRRTGMQSGCNEMRRGPVVNDEDLKRRLDALGASVPVSSKIARLRVLYDHIDAALGRGATRQDVLDVLNSGGFSMTMASFKSALQRIRAQRKGTRVGASADTLSSSAGSSVDANPCEPTRNGRKFPESLADIFAAHMSRRSDR